MSKAKGRRIVSDRGVGRNAEESSAGETRERLLDCALTLFAEKGYAAASIRDIIGAAGVTQPTLYHYFDGKLGLFLELLRTKYGDAMQDLRAGMATVAGCRAKLHVIMAESFSYCSADPRVPRLMFQTAFGPPIPGVTKPLDRLAAQRFGIVRDVIEDGIHAGEIRRSSVDGLALAFCCLMDQHINVLSRSAELTTKLTPALATWLVELFLEGAS